MRKQTLALAMLLAAVGSVAFAQGKGGPPQPPLLECGVHGDIDIICGTRSPEDLELTPDGKYILVGNYLSQDFSILKVDGTSVTDTGKRFQVPGHPASARMGP